MLEDLKFVCSVITGALIYMLIILVYFLFAIVLLMLHGLFIYLCISLLAFVVVATHQLVSRHPVDNSDTTILLEEAISHVGRDEMASIVLGENIYIGEPPTTGQSSRFHRTGTSKFSFPVQGSMGDGVVTVKTRDGKIIDMFLNMSGEKLVYSIDVSKGSNVELEMIGTDESS